MMVLKKPNRTKILTSVFMILCASFLLWLFKSNGTALAADTTETGSPPATTSFVVSGLTANDATVTDGNGNAVTADDNYYSWSNYNVHYNWSIADDVPIVAGDTATFELPSNVKPIANMTGVPVYSSTGALVGSFSIEAGASTGTLTFNSALANTTTGRKGTLSLSANGTNSSVVNPGDQSWAINKVGWLSDYTAAGLPKYVVWNVAFNPNNQHLTNVVITDQLGPNQTYVDGSVNAPTGYYDAKGTFISDGGSLQPQVTVNDNNQVQFNFGTVDTAVDMTFKVLIDVSITGTNNWTDNATLTSDQMSGSSSANVSYGGSGTGDGSQKPLGSVLLQKTDPDGNPLTGAAYELKDSTGDVIMSEATVDDNGQLNIKDLPVGTYTLTEVKAPAGYDINPQPISFTVAQQGTETQIPVINLTQVDQKTVPQVGSVLFNKTSATTLQALPGAEYSLSDAAGNVLQTGLVTDANGQIQVNDLAPGDYVFKETKAPAGYALATQTVPFTITANNIVTVGQADEPLPLGKIILTKVDATDNHPLAGAVYQIADANGTILHAALTTDSNGQVTISDLPDGTYTLTEVQAPEGYVLDSTPATLTIENGQTYPLTFKNEPLPGLPSEPEVPTEPENPTEPEVPTEPGTPTEPENPGEPEVPTEPGTPTEPENPSEPEVPTEPGTPTEPENPSEPEVPTEPGTPTEPENPSEPEVPTEPGTPTEPENPSEPEVPTEPGTPTEPENPLLPEYPNDSEVPTAPVNPTTPSVPSPTTPIVPNEPALPVLPGTPGISEAPALYPNNTSTSQSYRPSASATYPTPSSGLTSTSGSGQTAMKRFPQTGSKQEPYLPIIGLLLLIVFGIGLDIKRRRKA